MKENLVVGKIEQLTQKENTLTAIYGELAGATISANLVPTTIFNLGGFVINASSNTISWQNRVLTTDKEIVDAMVELINERSRKLTTK